MLFSKFIFLILLEIQHNIHTKQKYKSFCLNIHANRAELNGRRDRWLDHNFFLHLPKTFRRQFHPPPRVQIPQRYFPDPDETLESVDPVDIYHKQQKAEQVKKLLAIQRWATVVERCLSLSSWSLLMCCVVIATSNLSNYVITFWSHCQWNCHSSSWYHCYHYRN